MTKTYVPNEKYFSRKYESKSDRQTTSAAAGLIGSSLTAIAATGFPGMETLMNNANASQNQDNSRRSSTPSASPATTTASSGGFSSIFNLKSVISAATKSTHPQQQQQQQHSPVQTPPNSNFYIPPPVTTFGTDQSAVIESHAISSNISQKSVQGSLKKLVCSVCSHLYFCGGCES